MAALSLYLVLGYLDRSAMRENLNRLGVGRWSDCASNVKIAHIFSGSDSHHYKLSIPPQDVDQFLAALQAGGFEQEPPRVVRGRFPGSASIREDWWRPQDERELLMVEQRPKYSNGWTLWYAAASKDTGHVYMHRVGF